MAELLTLAALERDVVCPTLGMGKPMLRRAVTFCLLVSKTASRASVSNPWTIHGECTVGPNSGCNTPTLSHLAFLSFLSGGREGPRRRWDRRRGSTLALPRVWGSSEAEAGKQSLQGVCPVWGWSRGLEGAQQAPGLPSLVYEKTEG